MKTLKRGNTNKLWQRYWNEMDLEFFKVESLQDYGAEDLAQSPSYAMWLAGDKEGSINYIKGNAVGWAKQTSEKSVKKIRIHIVSEPYSQYLEWEIMHYKLSNIPIGGEIVYLVNRDELSNAALIGDFMVFDNRRVAHSHYTETGMLQSMDFYDEDEDIGCFLRAKHELVKYARILSAE